LKKSNNLDAGADEEIPLPNVKINVLRKVLEYCEKYKNENPPEIEKPLKSTNLAEVVPEFDAKYIDIENLEEIFDIILAANYLDIKPLLDLSCAKIASLIKGEKKKIIFILNFVQVNPQKRLERHLTFKMTLLQKKKLKSEKRINGLSKLINFYFSLKY